MHEMALMAEMVDALARSAGENKLEQISKVKLVVGKMTMALPDALRLAFEALKAEPLFNQNAVLEIEEMETVGRCGNCEHTFVIKENYLFICPKCKGLQIELISGRELYIDHYQGEEVQEN